MPCQQRAAAQGWRSTKCLLLAHLRQACLSASPFLFPATFLGLTGSDMSAHHLYRPYAGMVEDILPRRSELANPPVANVDQVCF